MTIEGGARGRCCRHQYRAGSSTLGLRLNGERAHSFVGMRSSWKPVAGILVATLAACSSGGSSQTANSSTSEPSASRSSSSSPSPNAAPDGAHELEIAVRAYSAAFLGGEGDAAYQMLSARCRNRVAHDQFVLEVAVAKQAYGDAAMQTFSIDQISGGLARVTYTYDKAAINQASEPWAFEDGAWHEDDC